MKKLFLISALIIFACLATLHGQANTGNTSNNESVYIFEKVYDLPSTSVKDQAATGTCWCFATTSFIESELLRMGKGEFDLSEMFIVRNNYTDRLKDNYLRRGKGNTGPGSLAHDFMRIFTEKGIVPDNIYPGLNYGSASHNHSELQEFIDAVSAVPVKRRNESDQYYQIVDAILDSYLGTVPESFTWNGRTYTPQSFAGSLGINASDYVQITSFTHFPFYSLGILEVPDNWAMEKFYNVPVDELVEIMNYALSHGFTVNWDGDTSEPGFRHSEGYAVLSSGQVNQRRPATDRSRFEASSTGQGPQSPSESAANVLPEQTVTQKSRQEGYENFSTTDDHLMHITGMVKDQNGTRYYKTKNSWGTDRNPYGGYLNMSENYIRSKTLFIMVHKDAIPAGIKSKLNL